MHGISFIQQSKLGNVAGRIDYISSEAKQEYLYSVYETMPEPLWTELSKECQQEFHRSGTTGKCVEARELIIALPPQFAFRKYDETLKYFTDFFKDKYGVECISALHHNSKKTNFHIHLIYSERELLEEPIEKVASRNMYFDEHGRHVRTKKEVTEDGKLRPGCKMIPKGEVYERHVFSSKKKKFKSKEFLDEVKHEYTDLINSTLLERYHLSVYNPDSPFLPTKKIGKNNPNASQIIADNAVRDEWNTKVQNALMLGIHPNILNEIKREEIVFPINDSVREAKKQGISRKADKAHEQFRSIIRRATRTLGNFMFRFRQLDREQRKKIFGESLYSFLKACRATKVPPERNTRRRELER